MTRPRTWRERNPAAFNAAWRRWYEANRARKIGWQAQRREAIRSWLRELKVARGCAGCDEQAPECLHFHHDDPSLKEITIAHAISAGWSKARILAEVAKCRVLCANCHLKLHWGELIDR